MRPNRIALQSIASGLVFALRLPQYAVKRFCGAFRLHTIGATPMLFSAFTIAALSPALAIPLAIIGAAIFATIAVRFV
jgi:hypothetical protein